MQPTLRQLTPHKKRAILICFTALLYGSSLLSFFLQPGAYLKFDYCDPRYFINLDCVGDLLSAKWSLMLPFDSVIVLMMHL